MTLSTPLLLDLLSLFDQGPMVTSDIEGGLVTGIPAWALERTDLSPKARAEWLALVGYAGIFPVPFGDEWVEVELSEDEDPARRRYRCPETFRLKSVEMTQIAVYAVQHERLLHAIADLLEIPQPLRKGIDAPLLDGTLWNLGKARIGPAHEDVWFVRGLAQSADAVFRYFHSAPLPDRGLILTSGQPLPEFVRPPKDYRFASLRQVLVDYAATPSLDMDLLHRILATAADGTLRPSLPVHFNEYTNTLVIRSKSSKPWHLKGDRQAAAIRYMYAQALNDRWLLPAGEILSAVYPKKAGARSQRMQNLFSGNTDWEDYIANPEKGKYGFRLT